VSVGMGGATLPSRAFSGRKYFTFGERYRDGWRTDCRKSGDGEKPTRWKVLAVHHQGCMGNQASSVQLCCCRYNQTAPGIPGENTGTEALSEGEAAAKLAHARVIDCLLLFH